MCAVGYKSKYIPLFIRIFNAQFKRRSPLSELFFADADFEQPLDLDAPPFNQFGRNYEICQWAHSSYNPPNRATTHLWRRASGVQTGKWDLKRWKFTATRLCFRRKSEELRMRKHFPRYLNMT